MITLDEIAKLANVSRRTVSRALKDKSSVKEETYNKIMALIDEHDYKPSLSAKSLSISNKKIVFLGYHSESSLFHNALIKHAKEKAAEIERFNIKVEFITDDTLLNLTQDEVDKIVENFNADVLITLPKSKSFPLISALIEKATEKNIPIIYVNMDGEDGNRLCYVGCDYIKSGAIAAGLMGLVLNKKGRIAILNLRHPNVPSSRNRELGFKKELETSFKKIKVVYENMAYSKYPTCVDELKRQKLDAIYIINPGDYSMCSIIHNEIDPNIKIITNDLLEENRELLKDGTICAVVYQDPKEQANKAIDIAYFYLLSNKFSDFRDPHCPLSVLIGQCL